MNNTIVLKEAAGYNLPLSNSISLMRRHIRGDCSGNAFVIAHYNNQGTRTVLHEGFIRTDDQVVYNLDVINSSSSLKAFLDSENQEARFAHCCTVADYYKKESGTMALLFMKCKDGVIGIAWLDNNGSSRKALLMCGFIGYELGVINSEKDKILWESATHYLIDDAKLIRDVKDLKRILQLSFMAERNLQESIEIVSKNE